MSRSFISSDITVFFNIFVMGEMPEEWKNSIITPKCGKQKWRTTEELVDLTYVIAYIVKF